MAGTFMQSLPARLDLPVRPTLLATDVDGTLTRNRAIGPDVLDAIARLTHAGIEVMPVTGRPAGEAMGLCRYLPGVKRAIAENGLVLVAPDVSVDWLGPPTDLPALVEVGTWLNAEHDARLVRTPDAFCRLGDVAYEREGREAEELERLRSLAAQRGVHLVWSNVHVHLAARKVDKGEGLLEVLQRDGRDPAGVVTIGDAPNDAGLFVADRFGLTVGTADVVEHREALFALPQYVSQKREADAFLELTDKVLAHIVGT